MGNTPRLDRFLILLFGLLLTAAGVLALLLGLGVFGAQIRDKPTLDNVISDYVGRNGQWLWPVIALVGLLLGMLALRWLIAQLTPTAVRNLQLEPTGTTGHTELTGSAITSAVSDEIASYRGVTGSSARLTGDDTDPQLVLRVQLDRRADIAAVRDRITSSAVAHARQVLDAPQLPVQLDLVVTDKPAARVS